MDEISPSCVACKIILDIMSNLLWASSLMASFFSCFTVKVLKDFRVMAVARERIRLVSLRVMPAGSPTPLANVLYLHYSSDVMPCGKDTLVVNKKPFDQKQIANFHRTF